MTNNDTLLAHLVPALTNQVEVAATKSLAFILNKSAHGRKALNELVKSGEFELDEVTRAEAEVPFDGGARVDVVCYDHADEPQLLMEAKFWASLGENQASAYFEYLDPGKPGVLMVVAPDRRIDALWPEILSQFNQTGLNLNELEAPHRCRLAKESGSKRRVMLISWAYLLDRIAEASDESVKSDIRQLRGLAQQQDDEAPLPLHPEDLSPQVGRRVEQLYRIADDATSRAIDKGLFLPTGNAAVAYRGGYGRSFVALDGQNPSWFGFEYKLWGSIGPSPLWVQLHVEHLRRVDDSTEVIDDPYGRSHLKWIPIELRTGAEHDLVVGDVLSQLERIVLRLRPEKGSRLSSH